MLAFTLSLGMLIRDDVNFYRNVLELETTATTGLDRASNLALEALETVNRLKLSSSAAADTSGSNSGGTTTCS